ncbi:hypothetical protein CWI75_14830 [Kineobactrum sediminis]|uniref:TonB-dependent receptor n=1 Tax=Kineobactrum sediminis TaxID=1905677 RepID=A0A2N5XZI7_9GAMM|nr:TonB-dependent receptor [Kineobactrum sediminis]PLW81509.1 hypothetical protein CWI75_14830 [Kineobactrum sediminis]
MKHTTLAIAAAALLLAPPGQTANMDTVTVTGSRLPQATLGAHSSLSRTEIERINAPDTVTLLKQVPNLLISRNGGPGGHAFASIRGGEPNFILVMINGVAVNDPTNSSGGGFDFNQLDPSIIERVEVYRGGISAVHGGEAISGVIHFITRERGTSSVAVEAGGDGQRRANVTLAGTREGPWSALLSLAAAREDSSVYANYDNQQALLQLQAKGEDQRHQLLFSGSRTNRESLAEDSGGIRFADPLESEIRDSQQWLASWHSEHQADGNRTWTTRLSWSRHQEEIDNPGIRQGVLSGIPPSVVQSDYRKLDGEFFVRWKRTPDLSFIAGVSGQRADGYNRGTLDFGFPVPVDYSLTRETVGAFAEGSLRLGATSLDLGARYDAPSGFDSESSARISLSRDLGPGTRLFAAYSEGYKLPSFFALAHPLVGNPALKPELSRNSEIGLATETTTGTRLQVSLFHNRYQDLVDFDADLFLSVNRSEVTAKGAELQGTLPLASWLWVNLDITYLDTAITDSDSRLRRRPQWSGGLQLQAELGPVELMLAADSRGSFHDASVATGPVKLGGYTDINATLLWQVSERLRISANVDNLGNRRLESSIGFYAPGRRARIGLQLKI